MIDFLIIGQGIAGTILSYLLTDKGYRVVVIDEDKPHTSSRVAAGIYNPITGRVMKKTWKADVLFEMLEPFYRKMEVHTGAEFLHEIPIYRPFVSVEEQNDWVGKSAAGDFDHFIEKIATKPEFDQVLNDPYGGLLLKNCGYLDIPVMLNAWKQRLKETEAYRNERFDEAKLEVSEDGIRYGDLQAKQAVLCQGNASTTSKWFAWLPFRPVKGEVLSVSAEEVSRGVIYNRGVFMLPVGEHAYRVGATYNWRTLDTEPTEEAKEELLERLRQLYPHRVAVQGHVAGIRPATKDRRPLLGIHPEHSRLAIFNGLGTKGVSLAPYFGSQMADFLTQGAEISPEVNISRFYSLYFH